jgi:hypothetical protein
MNRLIPFVYEGRFTWLIVLHPLLLWQVFFGILGIVGGVPLSNLKEIRIQQAQTGN